MAQDVRLKDVAESFFQMSTRWYRILADEGKVPEVNGGKIDFLLASKAVIKYWHDLAQGKGGVSQYNERTKLIATQAAIKDLELKIKQGEYIPRETVLQEFLLRISYIKQPLMTLHRTVRDPQDRERVKNAVRHYLGKFSAMTGMFKK